MHAERPLRDLRRSGYDSGLQLLNRNANVQSGSEWYMERLQLASDPAMLEDLRDGYTNLYKQCLVQLQRDLHSVLPYGYRML